MSVRSRAMIVRRAAIVFLCLSILGPVGPRKLLRLLAPVSPDQVALVSDSDRLDDLPQGVLPQPEGIVPVARTGSKTAEPDAPARRDAQCRIETSRSPPAA